MEQHQSAKKVANDTKNNNTQRIPSEQKQHSQKSILSITFMDTLCLVKALLLRSWYMQWMGRNPVMLALRLLVTATRTACAVTTCDNTKIHLHPIIVHQHLRYSTDVLSRMTKSALFPCVRTAMINRWQTCSSQSFLLRQDIYNSACNNNMTGC